VTRGGFPAAVHALAGDGNSVYIGGTFDFLRADPIANLAAVDANDGMEQDWHPSPSGTVSSLLLDGTKLYVGGVFGVVANEPQSHLAVISTLAAVGVPAGPAPSGIELVAQPNPARASATLRFTLPTAANVTLTVYDAGGRPMAALLRGEPRAAGPQSVRLDTAGWASGVYFARLTRGRGAAVVRKVVILR